MKRRYGRVQKPRALYWEPTALNFSDLQGRSVASFNVPFLKVRFVNDPITLTLQRKRMAQVQQWLPRTLLGVAVY